MLILAATVSIPAGIALLARVQGRSSESGPVWDVIALTVLLAVAACALGGAWAMWRGRSVGRMLGIAAAFLGLVLAVLIGVLPAVTNGSEVPLDAYGVGMLVAGLAVGALCLTIIVRLARRPGP